MSGIIPGTPGTTTRRDSEGNVLGSWYNDAQISEQVWEAVADVQVITATPQDPIAQMWEVQAAAPPPVPWISTTAPQQITKLSISTQDSSRSIDMCSLLNLVPGLGAWLGIGCRGMDSTGLANSIVSFFRSFKKRMFAVYFGRRLLGLMAQEGLDDFMKTTKRKVRSQIRIRRSS